jgi:hypothetical protein
LPTTNCPPQTTAVVVANSTPTAVVLVLTRLLDSLGLQGISTRLDAQVFPRGYERLTPIAMLAT